MTFQNGLFAEKFAVLLFVKPTTRKYIHLERNVSQKNFLKRRINCGNFKKT